MAQKKQLGEDISINNDFNMLTRSYQQQAVGQINFARYSVVGSREYIHDISDVFGNVQSSYKNLLLRKNIKSIVKKNGKDVWVLITANNKLYGDIIQKICRLFAENVKKSDPKKIDLIIIGRQGKEFFNTLDLDIPYKYFELPDMNVSVDYLKEICQNFILYENVIVYYGKFNNIISQSPVAVSISGEVIDENTKLTQNQQASQKSKKAAFIFEPSIEEIIVFFENQILSLLLNQTVQEAQLARFASRINAMEIAQGNIQKQLNLLSKEEKLLKNMDMNKKQLELLAGRRLWGARK
ncbi:MAG TPA: F0F1 ATP synthase subunit gamma [Candidatus Saccharimonadales bacterium]|nr:F0F1 ATP synthase subunit gamma [Candidatus Saccharimonadales bacterium]